MMLPEMTSSARVARAFQRFARGAGVGLALGALAACGGGGGGSSTPAKTTPTPETPAPEMTITPVDDILANAVDVTGMETVEGELDTADDVDYYKIRVDEPTEVTLWVDTPDVEIQVLDSEGNVLATTPQNSGGGSASGLATASAATPQAFFGFCLLPVGHVACIRVVLGFGTAIVRIAAGQAIKRGTKYALRQAVRAGAFIRSLGRVGRKNLEVGKPEFIDCNKFFTTTEEAIPLSCSARVVSLNLGPFMIGIQGEGSITRLDPLSTSICRDRAAPKTATLALVAGARIPPGAEVPEEIREGVATVFGTTLFERTLIDNGPRLRSTVTPPISLAVAGGGSATTTLTDFIEDPEGGPLTFAVGSAPAGLRATPAGSRLTVAAGEDAEDGTITVAATDRNNVCRTFPVQVRVERQVRVKPEYSDGVTGSAVAGSLYVSRDVSEYFDNPLDENLSFAVAHSGGIVVVSRHQSSINGHIIKRWYWGISQGSSIVLGSDHAGLPSRTHALPPGGNRLVVRGGVHMDPGHSIRVLLTAKDSAGSASLEFTITTAQRPSTPVRGCFSDRRGFDSDLDHCVDSFYSLSLPSATPDVGESCGPDDGDTWISRCPRTGGEYRRIGVCRIGSLDFFNYIRHTSISSLDSFSSACTARSGGTYTRLK